MESLGNDCLLKFRDLNNPVGIDLLLKHFITYENHTDQFEDETTFLRNCQTGFFYTDSEKKLVKKQFKQLPGFIKYTIALQIFGLDKSISADLSRFTELKKKIKEKLNDLSISRCNNLDLLVLKFILALKKPAVYHVPKNGKSLIIENKKYDQWLIDEIEDLSHSLYNYFRYKSQQNLDRISQNIVNVEELLSDWKAVNKKNETQELNEIFEIIKYCINNHQYLPLLFSVSKQKENYKSHLRLSLDLLNIIHNLMDRFEYQHNLLKSDLKDKKLLKKIQKLEEINAKFQKIKEVYHEIVSWIKNWNSSDLNRSKYHYDEKKIGVLFSRAYELSELNKKLVKGREGSNFFYVSTSLCRCIAQFIDSIKIILSESTEIVDNKYRSLFRMPIQSQYVLFIDMLMNYHLKSLQELKIVNNNQFNLIDIIEDICLRTGEIYVEILESIQEIRKERDLNFLSYFPHKITKKAANILNLIDSLSGGIPETCSALLEKISVIRGNFETINRSCHLSGGLLHLGQPLIDQGMPKEVNQTNIILSIFLGQLLEEFSSRSGYMINRIDAILDNSVKNHKGAIKLIDYKKFIAQACLNLMKLMPVTKENLEERAVQYADFLKRHGTWVDLLSIYEEEICHKEDEDGVKWNKLIRDLDSFHLFFSSASLPLIKIAYQYQLLFSANKSHSAPKKISKNQARKNQRTKKHMETPKPLEQKKIVKKEKITRKEEPKKEAIKADEHPGLKAWDCKLGRVSSPEDESLVLPLLDKIQCLRHFCTRLEQLRFLPYKCKEEQKTLEDFKTEAIRNLIFEMDELEEIVCSKKKGVISPAVIARSQLMIACAIEQSLKFLIANRDITNGSVHVLMDDQGQNRLLNQHRISDLLSLLLNSDKEEESVLNKEDVQFIHSLELVIPSSSRNLGFICDDLSEIVHTSLTLRALQRNQPTNHQIKQPKKLLKKGNHEFINRGINILIKLLNTFDPAARVESHKICELTFVPVALMKHFDELAMPDSLINSIHRLKEECGKIQQLRDEGKNNYAGRKVMVIDRFESEEQISSRKRLITQSLIHLQSSLKILEDLLQDPMDSSLCLTYSKTLLTLKGAILEKILLIVLSYLPIKAGSMKGQHVLFSQTHFGVKKYSHAIEEFILILIEYARNEKNDAMIKILGTLESGCAGMELFIKQLYRYHMSGDQPIHDLMADLQNLSHTRLQMDRGSFSLEEKHAWDETIQKYVLNQIRQPLAATLQSLVQLLSHYRTFLEARLNQ